VSQSRLTLVRHGRSAVDPATPPRRWSLAPDAAAGVASLRASGLLPAGAAWYSSPEPKAVATAAALTDRPVTVVDDLREAERPATWFDDPAEFVVAVRRSVQRPDEAAVPGWEPVSVTRSRVATAVRSLLADPDRPKDLVLVGHGTAWTLLVAELTGRPTDLAAWERMAMPDLAVLEVPPASSSAKLVRDWGQVIGTGNATGL
jgi:broad specificity phosphatase PhoE